MPKYKLIKSDGTISFKDTGVEMSLKEMQEFVGGFIEYVGNIICNEDGLRLKLPRNKYKPRFMGNIIEEL